MSHGIIWNDSQLIILVEFYCIQQQTYLFKSPQSPFLELTLNEINQTVQNFSKHFPQINLYSCKHPFMMLAIPAGKISRIYVEQLKKYKLTVKAILGQYDEKQYQKILCSNVIINFAQEIRFKIKKDLSIQNIHLEHDFNKIKQLDNEMRSKDHLELDEIRQRQKLQQTQTKYYTQLKAQQEHDQILNVD